MSGFIQDGAVLIKSHLQRQTTVSEEMFQEKDQNQEINNFERNGQNSSNSAISSSHPQNDVNLRDIETAAQDAVLREQVCLFFYVASLIMFRFTFLNSNSYLFIFSFSM